jgi:hypothetical protein
MGRRIVEPRCGLSLALDHLVRVGQKSRVAVKIEWENKVRRHMGGDLVLWGNCSIGHGDLLFFIALGRYGNLA